jgi:hypothetical protein
MKQGKPKLYVYNILYTKASYLEFIRTHLFAGQTLILFNLVKPKKNNNMMYINRKRNYILSVVLKILKHLLGKLFFVFFFCT